MSPQQESSEREWTIYVCPNCGKRKGGAHFCRCVIPSSRCVATAVIPESAPQVLSKEEAGDVACYLEGSGREDIQALWLRLKDWADS